MQVPRHLQVTFAAMGASRPDSERVFSQSDWRRRVQPQTDSLVSANILEAGGTDNGNARMHHFF